MLYFNDVAQLRDYSEFRVERNFPVTQGKKPASSIVFNIVGIRCGVRELLAEFPAQLPAEIFRDLCKLAIR